jgi:hypothetical protein
MISTGSAACLHMGLISFVRAGLPARSQRRWNDMYTNSHMHGQIDNERRRDMLAGAEQRRRARWFRTRSRPAPQAEQPEQHLGRAVRPIAGLRTVISRITARGRA